MTDTEAKQKAIEAIEKTIENYALSAEIIIDLPAVRAYFEALIQPVEKPTLPEAIKERGLTPHQVEIMELVSKGMENKDIANALGRSVQTVKNQMSEIMIRLGAANRTNAAMLYLQAKRSGALQVTQPAIQKEHEYREMALRDHQFLKQLCQPWSAYGGSGDDKIIKIVAVQGLADDWAAYMEMPWTPSGADGVINLGNKIPQNVAEEIFPAWAKKYTYRP